MLRALGDRLSAQWNQPIVIDTRPGANEILAADVVAKSLPDGYTLFIGTESTFANNAYLFSELPYDPVRDLLPVSQLYDIQFGLIGGQLMSKSRTRRCRSSVAMRRSADWQLAWPAARGNLRSRTQDVQNHHYQRSACHSR